MFFMAAPFDQMEMCTYFPGFQSNIVCIFGNFKASARIQSEVCVSEATQHEFEMTNSTVTRSLLKVKRSGL